MSKTQQPELPVETDPADNRLPSVKLDKLQTGLRHFLKASNIREGSATARKLEVGFLAGHELTHKLNPGVAICLQAGRSILTL